MEAFELAQAYWPTVEQSARRLLALLVDGLSTVLDRFLEGKSG
jgi:hypothetical protein